VSKNTPLPAAYRWLVASRSVAAIFGGYALAAAWAACMSLWLQKTGMARVDAVTTATMSSFVVHLCAALWVFAVASTRRAWIGIALPGALLAAGTVVAKGMA
jgi:uncharacterized membrane protein